MTIFCDMDGVITKPFKVWDKSGKRFKIFSDRDSSVISWFKHRLDTRLIFISIDKIINKKYAKHKEIKFIHANRYDKYEYIKEYYEEMFGSLPDYEYTFIGDSMADFKALSKAQFAYTPSDASLILQNSMKTIKKNKDHAWIKAPIKGGEGVLEFVQLDLLKRGII